MDIFQRGIGRTVSRFGYVVPLPASTKLGLTVQVVDFVADPSYLPQINEEWNELIPHILDYNYTVCPSQRDAVTQKIRQFYFKDKPVSKDTYPLLIQVGIQNLV